MEMHYIDYCYRCKTCLLFSASGGWVWLPPPRSPAFYLPPAAGGGCRPPRPPCLLSASGRWGAAAPQTPCLLKTSNAIIHIFTIIFSCNYFLSGIFCTAFFHSH